VGRHGHQADIGLVGELDDFLAGLSYPELNLYAGAGTGQLPGLFHGDKDGNGKDLAYQHLTLVILS